VDVHTHDRKKVCRKLGLEKLQKVIDDNAMKVFSKDNHMKIKEKFSETQFQFKFNGQRGYREMGNEIEECKIHMHFVVFYL